MEDGNTFSVSIKGNKTNSDLAAAINSQVGRNIASINTSTGELELTDVKAMYRRDADTQSTFSTPTTKFSVGTSPDTTTLSGDLTVTLSMNDGVTSGTRTLTIAAGTTMKDAALQIAQASGATSAEMTYNSSGGWDMCRLLSRPCSRRCQRIPGCPEHIANPEALPVLCMAAGARLLLRGGIAEAISPLCCMEPPPA